MSIYPLLKRLPKGASQTAATDHGKNLAVLKWLRLTSWYQRLD